MTTQRVVELLAATIALVTMAQLGGCSLANRAGPDVTCADLDGGLENDCADGIIAYCPDGQTVKYKVCTEDYKEGETTVKTASEICDADWQSPGAYRCEITDKACFGCVSQ